MLLKQRKPFYFSGWVGKNSFMLLWVLFETGSYCAFQADLRLTEIYLPLPPKYWDSKPVPPCPAALGFLSPFSPIIIGIGIATQIAFPSHPGVSPVVTVFKHLDLDCPALLSEVEGGDHSIAYGSTAMVVSPCSPPVGSPGASSVGPHWYFWEQESQSCGAR